MSLLHRMAPISLLSAISFLLPAQDADIAERLFRSGERAYSAHSFGEAQETWNQLLQASPKSPFAAEALLRLAHHQLDVEKNPDAALLLLDRIKTDHLKTAFAAEAMVMRGSILASRSHKPQELKEAIAEFNRVLDLFPDHSAVQSAHYQLGLAFRQQGQWGRALKSFTEAMRLDPISPIAPLAQLQAAEVLDIMGDGQGCLRLLQGIRNDFPQSTAAAEAEWRIGVRVKFRIQKPPLKSEGSWPKDKQKWLKTPTLLGAGPTGELFIYQDDLDQAFVLKENKLQPVGNPVKSAKAMLLGSAGLPWLLTTKQGIVKETGSPIALGAFTSPTGAFLDSWGTIWACDSKLGSLNLIAADGTLKTVPSPSAVAIVPLPSGGAALASDSNRALLFLDAAGQPKVTVAYGKELAAPFKYVLALTSDPLGHVAAIVEGGDFDGVVLWGPDGAVLRSATFKTLGISGKFRAIAIDRQGGLILADRSNDLLIRLN